MNPGAENPWPLPLTNINTLRQEPNFYALALTLVPGIGPIHAKNLISYCGGIEEIFRTKKSALRKIPGVGDMAVDAIMQQSVFQRAEEECAFMTMHGIQGIAYTDAAYPRRLKNCIDAPVLLFFRGNADLNAARVLGIVGTRNATSYGKQFCEDMAEACREADVLIVSGLAYGIDIAAHRASLKRNIPTVGVLGHGLDRLYPPVHREIAGKMQECGGLLTEFMSKTKPDKQNFPRRNRIVAGMIDGLLVVETSVDGGAVITALLADSYNRDVMAVPGRVDAPYSVGCNYLIKTHKAVLVENPDDVLDFMQWKENSVKARPAQRELFIEFSPEEKLVVELLRDSGESGIDALSAGLPLTPSTLASALLTLEFQGVIASLPGKRYKLL